MRAFYFALALRFGMPVKAMLERVTSAELSEWMAFLEMQKEPGAVSGGETTEQMRKNFERLATGR